MSYFGRRIADRVMRAKDGGPSRFAWGVLVALMLAVWFDAWFGFWK